MTSEAHEAIVREIGTLRTHMDGQFEALGDRLERVEAQVTRTNGRVTELEAKEREARAVAKARSDDSSVRKLTRLEVVQIAGLFVALEAAMVSTALAALKFL